MKNSYPKSLPSLRELQEIQVHDNKELMIDLREKCPDIICEYRRKDSRIQNIMVREKIGEMLMTVQKRLKEYNPKMRLLVVEGYRCPEYQERYFLEQLLNEFNKNSNIDFETILEGAHRFVAMPSVAGHPTGGAIDLTIAYQGREIDMGGEIADFSNPPLIPTYSSVATDEQQKNRILLHDLMVGEGFAPFYGEWWHFSYGDREWAVFYRQAKTLYGTLML